MNTAPKKIIIIEDDTVTQELYLNVLVKEGYTVIQAFNAQEGLNLVKSVKPHLIILDLMLPGDMNGFDILERIKTDNVLKNIPVLVCTNLDSEQKLTKKMGANDYLIKSNIPMEELVEKVKQYLN